MCRYGMYTYKPHYACFDCRKAFKRRLLADITPTRTASVADVWFKNNLSKQAQQTSAQEPTTAKCPECGSLMANMGLDFKAPPKDNQAAWQHLRRLYTVGIAFHSCGCGGPGLVPATTEALVTHLEQQLGGYVQHLRYWLTRSQPVTRVEFEADRQQNWGHNWNLAKDAKGRVDAPAALVYWQARVQQLTCHITEAKKGLPKIA
jgi:DNA-directed RNA polymerase subunit RPC12/RpoP